MDAAPAHQRRQPRGTRRAARLWFAVSILLPLILFGAVAWHDYRSEEHQARIRVISITNALAEHAVLVLESADLVLARVLDRTAGLDWAQILASEELHQFLASLKSELQQAESIFLVDPRGRSIVSSRAFPMPDFDARQREYFTAAAEGDHDLYVSAPFRGRMAGTYAFTASRPRIRNGQFDGVAAVTLSPAYFGAFYRIASEHPQIGVAALIRTDGALLVRFPESEHRPVRIEPDDPMLQAVQHGVKSGVMLRASPVDGRTRLTGFRVLPGQPLLVSFGIDESSYLLEWYKHLAIFGGFAALAGAGLLVTAWLSLRQSDAEHAALRRLIDETERRQHAEASLQQLQKMEALGRLTGGVAHDFNNLLSAIMGSVELALKRVSEPRVIRLLSTAKHAAERGAKLTGQMLAFSRKQEIHVRSVDVNAVIREMDELMGRTLDPAIRIEYRLAPDLWPALADVSQLEMALLNLAVNARDAMPDGGGIRVSTRNVTRISESIREPFPPEGEFVCIEVADTGIGMSEEVRRHAFEPFYTTKAPGKGTGLGLSMVYGFTTSMGGTVLLDGAPGSGTKVSLFLPRAPSPPEPEAKHDPEPTAARQSRRILLVDDEEAVRELTAEMLRELGHSVTTAADADAALRILDRGAAFDLLLIDFNLPGTDGGQLAERIAACWPTLPIAFFSGYADAVPPRALSTRRYATLSKPCTTAQLAALVEREARSPGES